MVRRSIGLRKKLDRDALIYWVVVAVLLGGSAVGVGVGLTQRQETQDWHGVVTHPI